MTKNRIRMQRSDVALVVLAVIATVTTGACYTVPLDPLTEKNPDLTQGGVQLVLKTGVTTKHEVLEAFGAPNVTTRDGSGREIWSYQRQASVAQQTTEGFAVLFHRSAGRIHETSTRMITLIIHFDENDVVVDYKSRESNF